MMNYWTVELYCFQVPFILVFRKHAKLISQAVYIPFVDEKVIQLIHPGRNMVYIII